MATTAAPEETKAPATTTAQSASPLPEGASHAWPGRTAGLVPGMMAVHPLYLTDAGLSAAAELGLPILLPDSIPVDGASMS